MIYKNLRFNRTSVMKKGYLLPLLAALVLAIAPAAHAQEVTADTEVETRKRAQTGMKFLSLSVDARSTGMGEAVTAETQGTSTAMFYNPASMAWMEGTFSASFGQTQFITDINYNIASVAYRPEGNWGVFGISLTSVDYGDFFQTVRADNEAGYIDLGTYSPTALAVGLGYARAFSDKFSAGIHLKYAAQDLGSQVVARNDAGGFDQEDYTVNTIAGDFGIVYQTGYRSLVIAMSVRNFSQELTYVRENFELPLTFQIGFRMNMMDFTSLDPNQHSFNLAIDAQRPRDFTEHFKVGGEYTFMDILSLRAGMAQAVSEEQGLSLGAGLKYNIDNIRFGADYAYTDFGIFGEVNRFALNIGF